MSDHSSPAGGRKWTDQVADRVESIVGAVRDNATVPAIKVVQAVVFGLVAAVLGSAALVLLVIAVLRLHVYLPIHPEGLRIWITYTAMGAIFLLLGAFLWRKRIPRAH